MYTTALFNYATLVEDIDWGMLSLPRARHGGLSLIERFPLLLIDNARILTSDEFEQAVRANGGIVKFRLRTAGTYRHSTTGHSG